MYLYREYFKAHVYTIWVHEPPGFDILRYRRLGLRAKGCLRTLRIIPIRTDGKDGRAADASNAAAVAEELTPCSN